MYAIGDIHGRLDLLNDLIDRIDADALPRAKAESLYIFLGDLVDRGEDSRGVVERLKSFAEERRDVRFLMGNHEEVFLKAVSGDPQAMRFLTRIGGRETILSYGVTDSEYRGCNYEELAALLQARVPHEHRAFLSGFEDQISVGDYLFVHAGVRPGVDLDKQSAKDLRWIRGEFLSSRADFGKIVVHGHSISENVEVRSNRIGIDTGAFASGRLTALVLEQNRQWYLST